MTQFGVSPGLSLEIIDEEVVELQDKVPTSKNEEFILLGEQTGNVSSSGFRRVTLGLGFSPFKGIQIEFVDIIEGGSLIVHSSVSSKDDNLVLIVGHGVIGSGFRPSNLAHGIFRCPH